MIAPRRASPLEALSRRSGNLQPAGCVVYCRRLRFRGRPFDEDRGIRHNLDRKTKLAMTRLRVLCALVALVCHFSLSTVALSPLHGHSQRQCEVCATAHLPLTPGAEAIQVPAPAVEQWSAPIESRSRIVDFSCGPADPRGPPVLC